jgi:hypothetical protein
MTSLTEQDVGRLLADFRISAFRFETRDRYDSVVGRESFRRFVAGEVDDYSWHRPWTEMLRRDRLQGKTWQRVRIVSTPLSPWTRYALEPARLSVEAGDDIRYLRRDVAGKLGLRPHDAWILDDARLVVLRFDADDTFVDAEIVDDETVVRQHQIWRDVGWQHAQSLDAFVAANGTDEADPGRAWRVASQRDRHRP